MLGTVPGAKYQVPGWVPMPDYFWVPSRDSELSTDFFGTTSRRDQRPHGEADFGTWNLEPGTVPNQVSTGAKRHTRAVIVRGRRRAHTPLSAATVLTAFRVGRLAVVWRVDVENEVRLAEIYWERSELLSL